MNKSNKEIFFLTGFMGSGKSQLGLKMAQRLNLPFIDLDIYIEENEKKTVADIFAKSGEEHFRDLETQYCSKLVKEAKASMVIALGGGFPMNPNNHHLLKKGKVIFIEVDIEEIFKRLTPEEIKKRPLLTKDFEKAKKLYETRMPIYRATADYIVSSYVELMAILPVAYF